MRNAEIGQGEKEKSERVVMVDLGRYRNPVRGVSKSGRKWRRSIRRKTGMGGWGGGCYFNEGN